MKKATVYLILISLIAGVFGTLPAAAQSNFDVAILVVDDFSDTDLSAAEAEDLADGENCALNLEGQSFAVRGVSANPIDVPHGDLVYAQIEELLDEANASNWIDLIPVDIHGLTTDEVASAIEDAIADHPADFYVLNMSFAIIPCEYMADFADLGGQLMNARDAKELNRYRGIFQRAVVFYDKTVFPAMSHKMQDATDLDPLQSLLTSLGSQVIPVASAGNFGLDFPFWPGAWGQVISVSASEGTGYQASASWRKQDDTPLLNAESDNPNKPLRISHYGEVMLPGEYDSDEGLVSGTSFAAPRLSVLMALYVADVGGSYCTNSNGYPALASGDWDNLTLAETVQEYCPALAAYIP
ncbi:MAG: hypothetical protein JXA10_01455 [Anaerolineae bacterium]|nr:hypothetical protein [Anaerolineae bacterium]